MAKVPHIRGVKRHRAKRNPNTLLRTAFDTAVAKASTCLKGGGGSCSKELAEVRLYSEPAHEWFLQIKAHNENPMNFNKISYTPTVAKINSWKASLDVPPCSKITGAHLQLACKAARTHNRGSTPEDLNNWRRQVNYDWEKNEYTHPTLGRVRVSDSKGQLRIQDLDPSDNTPTSSSSSSSSGSGPVLSPPTSPEGEEAQISSSTSSSTPDAPETYEILIEGEDSLYSPEELPLTERVLNFAEENPYTIGAGILVASALAIYIMRK